MQRRPQMHLTIGSNVTIYTQTIRIWTKNESQLKTVLCPSTILCCYYYYDYPFCLRRRLALSTFLLFIGDAAITSNDSSQDDGPGFLVGWETTVFPAIETVATRHSCCSLGLELRDNRRENIFGVFFFSFLADVSGMRARSWVKSIGHGTFSTPPHEGLMWAPPVIYERRAWVLHCYAPFLCIISTHKHGSPVDSELFVPLHPCGENERRPKGDLSRHRHSSTNPESSTTKNFYHFILIGETVQLAVIARLIPCLFS